MTDTEGRRAFRVVEAVSECCRKENEMKRLSMHIERGRRPALGRRGRLGLMVLVLAMGAVASGGVSGINVLSEGHHVWGFAGESQGTQPTGFVTPYDQTSAAPLDVSVGHWPPGDPFPGYAHSVAGDFSVFAESAYWYSAANASSEYRFTPVDTLLCVRVYGCTDGWGEESAVRYTLTDSTLGSVVDEFEAIGAVAPDSELCFDWREDYAVDPGHEYVLTLYAGTTGSDWIRGAGITADLACVPVPSALMLGAIGAVLVAWRRRRSTHHG